VCGGGGEAFADCSDGFGLASPAGHRIDDGECLLPRGGGFRVVAGPDKDPDAEFQPGKVIRMRFEKIIDAAEGVAAFVGLQFSVDRG
jgi:hypothetical protein